MSRFLGYIFDGGEKLSPFAEILYLATEICPDFNILLLHEIHQDISSFFKGTHPDFRQNTMPYHNLRHSLMVVLATVRLFHGLHCNGVKIDKQILLRGILAAYFHDTGMLLRKEDPVKHGSMYLANHESRSASMLQNYLKIKNLPAELALDCAIIIQYTELASTPASFPHHGEEIRLVGQVVGSADILAQMADRYYLECLPLLFSEQQMGGINESETALELMEHTAYFYHNVVLKRLVTTFSDTMLAMRSHFRERHAIDRDLYLENIDRNMHYLKEILKKCDTIECTERYLRRIPPIL